MIDLLLWLVRKLGIQNLFTLALLLGAFSAFALALAQVVRGIESNLTLSIAVAGIALGWLLARAPASVAASSALLIGGEIIVVRVGQLGSKLESLARAFAQLVWQIAVWLRDWRAAPNAQPFQSAVSDLIAALSTLWARTRDWLSAAAGGVPAFDPVAVALTWSFVVWSCATWAAWSIQRHGKTLNALLPTLVVLSALLAYSGADSMYLAPLLGALLLLLPLASQRARERMWRRAHIATAEDLSQDVALVTIPLGLGILLCAYVTPSISIQALMRAAQERIAEHAHAAPHWADSLGVMPQPAAQTIFDQVRAPGLPRQHLLGAGAELSERLAMLVTPDEIISDADAPPRYYWRGSTYDRYTGRGWMTSATEITDYRAGESVGAALGRAQRIVTQTVEWLGAPSVLYATGALVTTDHAFRVAWRSPEDVFGASITATTYRVQSRVSVVGEKELRASGAQYPAWVRERYLTLPAEIPDRVRILARDLTATVPTPYARARALEAYLRQFPYTLELPAPPPNRDVVDYFLFDVRRGYCDYYATALVVLARAAGLPARLVVGYAPGFFDRATNRFVVTEAEAHAWAEIYFADWGWIEFEPTPSRARIERPAETAPSETRDVPEDRHPARAGVWRVEGVRAWGMLGVGLVGFAGLGILVTEFLVLRLLTPARAIALIFGRLTRAARGLDLPVRAAHTPNEIGAQLRGYLGALARAHAWWREAEARVALLTALYVQVAYSPRPADARDRARALRAWRALRWQLGLAWVWHWAWRKWLRLGVRSG